MEVKELILERRLKKLKIGTEDDKESEFARTYSVIATDLSM